MNFIETIDKEKTDLELHVDLCAQRYAELDRRLGVLEVKMDEVKTAVVDYKSAIIKACIATAGSVIVSVIGLVGVILTKVPVH